MIVVVSLDIPNGEFRLFQSCALGGKAHEHAYREVASRCVIVVLLAATVVGYSP